MNATKSISEVQAGDKIIINGGVDTVKKVTKARIYTTGGRELRRDDGRWIGRYSHAAVATPEAITAIEAAKAEQAARQEREENERGARQLIEYNAAWDACKGVLPISTHHTMPDGSRIVTMSLPLHPKAAERKLFQVVIARIKTIKSYSFVEGRERVKQEISFTYTTASSSSFSSISPSEHDSDEEALWSAVVYCYNNG